MPPPPPAASPIAIHPQVEMGDDMGGGRCEQTSLAVWWIFWFKVVWTDFPQARGIWSNQRIYQLWGVASQHVARLAPQVSMSSQHQLTLAQAAAPFYLSLHQPSHQSMLGCWAPSLVRGHWVLQLSKVTCSCFQCQRSIRILSRLTANHPPEREIEGFYFLLPLLLLKYIYVLLFSLWG